MFRIGLAEFVTRYLPQLIICAAILICPAGVHANDSLAAVATGGLELVTSEYIRILEEVLEISPNKVRVRYRFINDNDKDIHSTVAFPLPDCDCSSPLEYPPHYKNLEKSFMVRIDDRVVSTKIERKAINNGRDITAQLREIGLSDAQIFDNCYGNKKMTDLTTAQKTMIEKLRYGEEEMPWWVAVKFYWEMTFPSKREIVVDHEYIPAAGGGYALPYNGRKWEKGFPFSMEKLWDSFTGKDGVRKHEDCLDTMTKRGIEKRVLEAASERPDYVSVSYDNVEYILGTARNWKGPIGEFTLRLVKGNPDQLVSVCFPGKPQRTGPTVYEFHEKDFVPPAKLVVYFYSVEPKWFSSRTSGEGVPRRADTSHQQPSK